MNSYYLTVVLKPDLQEKARQELLDEIKGKIGQTKLAVKEDLWGSRDLAYPIKRHTSGYYAHFEFETDPKVVKGLDKSLKVEEDIVRFLLVKRQKAKVQEEE